MTRGRRRAMGWAAIALVLAGFALTRGSRPPAPVRSVSVVIAVRGVPAGRPITAADVALRRIPAAAVSPHQLNSIAAAVGRTTVVGLPAGSPVMDAEIASPAGSAGRDVAVRLDDLAGVPADAMAGTRADLYLTHAGRPPAIRRVLAGVLVVAATHSSDGTVATLRLAPGQVQAAIRAEGMGQLRLVALGSGE